METLEENLMATWINRRTETLSTVKINPAVNVAIFYCSKRKEATERDPVSYRDHRWCSGTSDTPGWTRCQARQAPQTGRSHNPWSRWCSEDDLGEW